MDRRLFLKSLLSYTISGTSIVQLLKADSRKVVEALKQTRHIDFFHTHTQEWLKLTYWQDNQYIQSELKRANHFLRDFRTNQIKAIDPKLFDVLWLLQNTVQNQNHFEIISGYRSPQTNRMLRKKGHGVAERSLHMQGLAIDVRQPGTMLDSLYAAAQSLQAGGTGIYHASNFIHLDTGRVRSW